MNTQNVITGNAKKIMVILEPYSIDRSPEMSVPQMAPKLLIDPTHDNSSYVNGPVASGVLFDRSTGNADENHPMLQPWQSMM